MINKILVFAFVGSLITASASAQNFTIEGVNYKVTNVAMKTVEIAASSCYDVAGGVFTPTTIRNGGIDYTITNIVDNAFNTCANLISVILPNSVTSIGNSVFVSCRNLASVILSNSITSIGVGLFSFCAKLTSVTLPNTLMRLEQGVFQDCTSLTSITLPNTLTSIGLQAFRSSGLTSITLPSSITSIDGDVFRDCTGLETVSINKVTPLTIFSSVFRDVTLTDLTLKVPVGSKATYKNVNAANAAVWRTFGTITEIDFEFEEAGINYVVTNTETPTIAIAEGSCYTANSGVFALTEVVNGDPAITYAITSIATAAFEDCTDLTAFTFPSTVTCVSSSTFKGCTGLATVTLPNSIREIGNNAFENCSGLATFSINKVVPLVINANVFEGASITTATLNVPTESVSAYAAAPVWLGFGTKEPVVNTESYAKENAFSISINNGFLEITQADKALKINRVQIINLLGQVVKTSEEKNSIALSNLPVGVYIVSVYTKNGRFSRKFVRE